MMKSDGMWEHVQHQHLHKPFGFSKEPVQFLVICKSCCGTEILKKLCFRTILSATIIDVEVSDEHGCIVVLYSAQF